MPFRTNGICNIITFSEYLRTLRHCCGGPHEAEDAREFLWEFEQGSQSFREYYLRFCEKKERSGFEDSSLIDCLKRNVDDQLQFAALSVTNPNNRKLTFDEYVAIYTRIDDSISKIKHLVPRTPASNPVPSKPKPTTTKPVPVVPVIATPFPAPVGGCGPMNLSSALVAVQGKTLATAGVKDICNKWKLCYYCKLQHPGKSAKDCPNKKPSVPRNLEVDDNESIDGSVSSLGEKSNPWAKSRSRTGIIILHPL